MTKYLKYSLRYGSLLAIFVLLLGHGFNTVSARKLSTGIHPPIMEIKTLPGENITQSLVIFGQTGDQISMNASVFQPKGEIGQVEILPDTNPDGVLDWITFPKQFFSLPSLTEHSLNSSSEVSFTINVPEDLPPKDYYITIFAENIGLSSFRFSDGAESYQVGKIGMNLLLSVISSSEDPLPRAEISNFSAKRIQSKPPFTLSGEVKNIGQRRFKTFGEVKLFDVFGREVDRQKLTPINVLVDSSRLLQNAEQPGEIVMSPVSGGNLSWVQKLLPNFYTAQLSFTPGDPQHRLVATTHFIYLPIPFFAIFTLFLSGSIFLSRYGKRESTNIQTKK